MWNSCNKVQLKYFYNPLPWQLEYYTHIQLKYSHKKSLMYYLYFELAT